MSIYDRSAFTRDIARHIDSVEDAVEATEIVLGKVAEYYRDEIREKDAEIEELKEKNRETEDENQNLKAAAKDYEDTIFELQDELDTYKKIISQIMDNKQEEKAVRTIVCAKSLIGG